MRKYAKFQATVAVIMVAGIYKEADKYACESQNTPPDKAEILDRLDSIISSKES